MNHKAVEHSHAIAACPPVDRPDDPEVRLGDQEPLSLECPTQSGCRYKPKLVSVRIHQTLDTRQVRRDRTTYS